MEMTDDHPPRDGGFESRKYEPDLDDEVDGIPDVHGRQWQEGQPGSNYPEGTIIGKDPETTIEFHAACGRDHVIGESCPVGALLSSDRRLLEEVKDPDARSFLESRMAIRHRATKVVQAEAYDRGTSNGLYHAERRVRQYMTGHFSEATISGVVRALRGEHIAPGWDQQPTVSNGDPSMVDLAPKDVRVNFPEPPAVPSQPQDGLTVDWQRDHGVEMRRALYPGSR